MRIGSVWGVVFGLIGLAGGISTSSSSFTSATSGPTPCPLQSAPGLDMECSAGSDPCPGIATCNCIAGYAPTGPTSVSCFGGSWSGTCLCGVCGADTYSATVSTDACTPCPTGRVTVGSAPADHNHLDDCGCLSGMAGSPCAVCGSHTYKTDFGPEDCTNCPPNSVTLGSTRAHHNERTDCKCNLGATGSDGGPCNVCSGNFYKQVTGTSSCIACPGWSTVVGSGRSDHDSVYDCKCPAGVEGNDGTACSVCGEDYYKPARGSQPCTSCPGFSNTEGTTKSDHDNLEDCSCPAGAYGADGTVCNICWDDSYSVFRGSSTCTACPTGSVTVGTSLSNHNQLSDCRCPAGTTGTNGNVCSVCGSGTYKPSWGESSCTTCPTPKSTEGSTAGDHDALADCACPPGYGVSGTTCAVCGTGAFKTNTADVMCTTCPIGSTTSGTLPANHDEVEDCFCVPGATGSDGSACTVCGADTYKSGLGSASCTGCPGYATTAGTAVGDHDAVTDCKCPAGTTGADGTACSICGANTYKPSRGSGPCFACGGVSVTTGSTAGHHNQLSDCACPSGYSGGSASCTVCADNKYKVGTGFTCTICPSGSTTVGSLGTDHDQLTDCRCPPGSTGANGGVCSECSTNTYKASRGNAACVSCPALSVTSGSGVSTHDEVTDCRCPAGTTGANGAGCSVCATNYYKTSWGPMNCALCPGNSVTSGTGAANHDALADCVCPSGYSGSNGACTVCGNNRYKIGFGTSCLTCPGMSVAVGPLAASHDALSDCTCPPGTTGPDGTSCSVCPDNTYKVGTGSSACTACPAGSVSSGGSPADFDQLTDCRCPPGTTGPDGSACSVCLANMYKASLGSTPCSACPGLSTTTGTGAGAHDNVKDCKCPSGSTGVDGTACTVCSSNLYKTTWGAAGCSACPGSAVTVGGALADHDETSDCMCPPAYTGPDGTACSLCPADTYKVSTGPAACTLCGENSVTGGAAPSFHDSPGDCTCIDDYERLGAPGTDCTPICIGACEPDTCVLPYQCDCVAGYVDGDGGCNFQPIIEAVPSPSTSAREDVEYVYTPAGYDLDDTATWFLDVFPASMTHDGATGRVVWTPVQGDPLSNPVTLRYQDDLAFNTVPVYRSWTITVVEVNDAPVLSLPPTYACVEDAVCSLSGIGVTDEDAVGDLEMTLSEDAGGTLSLGSTPPGGVVFTGPPEGSSIRFRGSLAQLPSFLSALIYTPADDFYGPVLLSVTVSDLGSFGDGGVQTASDSISFQVAGVNDAPTHTTPSLSFTTGEDTLASAGDLFVYVADVDLSRGGALQLRTSITCLNGLVSLTASPPAAVTVESGALAGSKHLVLSGNPNDLTALLASTSFHYLPDKDYFGADSIVVLTEDNGNFGSGAPLSVSTSFAATVTAINDAPEIVLEGRYTFDEDTNLTAIGLSVSDVDDLAVSVELVLSLAGSSSAHVRMFLTEGILPPLSLNLTDERATMSGSIVDVNMVLASLRIIPDDDFVSTSPNAVLTVTAHDGRDAAAPSAADLLISAVNDPPVIGTSAPVIYITEDVPQRVPGYTVYDVDASSLQAVLTSPDIGVTLSSDVGLTFVTGANGERSMTFTGAHDDVAFALSNLTLLAAENFYGSSTLTLTVSDMGLSGSGGVLTDVEITDVEVASVNDAPVLTGRTSYTALEDNEVPLEVITFEDVDLRDSDASGPVRVTIAATNGEIRVGGIVSTSFTLDVSYNDAIALLGDMSFLPAKDFDQTATIELEVDDLGNHGGPAQTDALVISIAFTPVNDVPAVIYGAGRTQVVPVNATTRLRYQWIIWYYDPDNSLGDGLRIEFVAGDTALRDGMTARPLEDPTEAGVTGKHILEWTPGPSIGTSDECTFGIYDDEGGETTRWVIAVDIKNDPPELHSSPPLEVDEGATYTYNTVVVDYDDPNDGEQLSFAFTTSPPGMTVNTTGFISWPVPVGAPVSVPVSFFVADGMEDDALPVTQSFTIRVNDRPFYAINPDIEENRLDGGVIAAEDRNTDDAWTWTYHDGADACPVVAAALPNLQFTQALDFEDAEEAECTFDATVTDTRGLSFRNLFTVRAVDVPEPPVAISASVVVRGGGVDVPQTVALLGTDEDTAGLAGAAVTVEAVGPDVLVYHMDGSALEVGDAVDGNPGVDTAISVVVPIPGTFVRRVVFCIMDASALVTCANVTVDVDVGCVDQHRKELSRTGVCRWCPFGYQGGPGRQCSPCGGGSYYVPAGLVDAPPVPCHPCPEGGLCVGGGVPPVAHGGFWAAPASADLSPGGYGFVQCVPAENCLGGEDCREGHTGERCSVCKARWYKDEESQLCSKCPPYTLIVILVSLFLMVILCVVLVKMSSRATAYFASASVGFNFLQVIAIMSRFDLHWPDEVYNFFRILSLVNIDVRLLRVECTVDVGGSQFFLIWMLKLFFPFLFMLIFMTGYGATHAYVKLLTAYGTEKLKSLAVYKYMVDPSTVDLLLMRRKFLNAYLSVLVYMYLIVTATALDIYACTDVGSGVKTMDAEPAITCGSARWNSMVAISVLILLFFSLGFPLVLYYVLHKRRYKLHLEKNVIAYGLLFRRYLPVFYLYEIVILVRKMGIVFGKVLFVKIPLGQASVAFIVICVAYGLHWKHQPFRQTRVNSLESFSLVCSMVILMTGIIFGIGEGRLGRTADIFFSIVVITAVVLGCIAMAIAVVLEMQHQYRLSRRGVVGRYASDTLNVEKSFFDFGCVVVAQQRVFGSDAAVFTFELQSEQSVVLAVEWVFESDLRKKKEFEEMFSLVDETDELLVQGREHTMHYVDVLVRRPGRYKLLLWGTPTVEEEEEEAEEAEEAGKVKEDEADGVELNSVFLEDAAHGHDDDDDDGTGGSASTKTSAGGAQAVRSAKTVGGDPEDPADRRVKIMDVFVSLECGSSKTCVVARSPEFIEANGVIRSPMFDRLFVGTSYHFLVDIPGAGAVVLSPTRPADDACVVSDAQAAQKEKEVEGAMSSVVTMFRSDNGYVVDHTPAQGGELIVWAKLRDEEAIKRGKHGLTDFLPLLTYRVIDAKRPEVDGDWQRLGASVQSPISYFIPIGTETRVAIEAPLGKQDMYFVGTEAPEAPSGVSVLLDHSMMLQEDDVFVCAFTPIKKGPVYIWGNVRELGCGDVFTAVATLMAVDAEDMPQTEKP